MIRDKKLAAGMAVAFVLGIIWGLVEGAPPGETFLRGSIAVFCALVTYPFWRDKKQ